MEMMLEFIKGVLVEEAGLVVPVLWFFGKILKETPRVEDWTIPYILTVLGILLAVGLIGINVHAIIQGVLVTTLAIYGHQLVKQTVERGEDQ